MACSVCADERVRKGEKEKGSARKCEREKGEERELEIVGEREWAIALIYKKILIYIDLF